MNKSLLVSLVLWLSAICVGCHTADDHIDPQPQVKEVHRAVLVYMVASNNLATYSTLDISEMSQAAIDGSLQGGRLFIYLVNNSAAPSLYEMNERGELILVKEYTKELSSVSMQRMAEVIDDFKAEAPAKDYGIVMWSHGSGWLVDGIETPEAPAAPPAPASFGQDFGSKMNVSALASVLRGRDFSFIYFDCCYMGAIEVLYELRDCADYIVSSPSEIPVYGMDYSINIPCFFAPKVDLSTAVRNTYEYYRTQDDPVWQTCTISLVKTSAISRLAEVSKAIFATAPWPAESTYEPQKYMTGKCYHYDLRDYISDIASPEQLSEFDKALADAVVCEYATDYLWKSVPYSEIKINTHCGLSSYVLYGSTQLNTKGYSETSWYKDVVSAMTERK